MRVALAGPTDVLGFRARANTLLAQQVAPAQIAWDAAVAPGCVASVDTDAQRPSSRPSALHAIVPRSFLRLTELVVLHRDAMRFDLLYRLLWRLVHEPELAASSGDADMVLAQSMAQAVRRDLLRAKYAARLRPLSARAGVVLQVGWIEPQHHVTEEAAQWLVRGRAVPPWLLASPDRSVLANREPMRCGPGVAAQAAREADDAYWYALMQELEGAVLVDG